MLNLVSLIIGLVALVCGAVAFLPLLGWAYWLIYPSERRMVPKVKRFREWLLAEMQRALEDAAGGWPQPIPVAAQ